MSKKKPTLWFEEPLDEFRRMQENFFGNMQDFFKKPFTSRFPIPDFKTKFISVRIAESDSELILMAELPGFNKDEIKLKVTSTSVDISAEKKKVSIEKGEKFFRQEKAYGSARRIVSLPAEVKTENIKTRFENGVLEVLMQKKETVKKKEEKEVKVE